MPAKTTTHATPTDQRPTCSVCGSHDVETTAWIQYRPDGTLAVVNSDGPFGDEHGNWCHDCQEHVWLDYPDTTPADDARRQAADAAREAGPELAAALADAIDRLALIAADMRGGIIDHVGGNGATKDYAAGVHGCAKRLCDVLARAGGRRTCFHDLNG